MHVNTTNSSHSPAVELMKYVCYAQQKRNLQNLHYPQSPCARVRMDLSMWPGQFWRKIRPIHLPVTVKCLKCWRNLVTFTLISFYNFVKIGNIPFLPTFRIEERGENGTHFRATSPISHVNWPPPPPGCGTKVFSGWHPQVWIANSHAFWTDFCLSDWNWVIPLFSLWNMTMSMKI